MIYYKDNICAYKKENEFLIFESETNSIVAPRSLLIFNETLNFFKTNLSNSQNSIIQKEIDLLFPKVKKTKFNTFNYLNRSIPSNKITLMLSQDCNLACKYCYGGESGHFGTSGNFMSYHTAIKSIDFLISQNNNNSNTFHITFFGGEPLMNTNLIYKIFDYCDNLSINKSYFFNYSITTNGTLLTKKMIKELKKRNVSLLISLDGPEKYHNKNRIFKNGKGSYQSILNKISLLKEYGKSFSIRATVEDSDFLEIIKNISFFVELGATQVHISNMSNYTDENDLFPINIENIISIDKLFFEEIEKIKKDFILGKNPFYIPFLTALNKIHLTNKSLVSCGFMKGTTAISTDGKLYPCHRFVGLEGFDFGNIINGVDLIKKKSICDSLDKSTKQCLNCFAKYICARSCVRDIAKSGSKFISFPENYCKQLRKNVAEYLLIYKQAKSINPELFNRPQS